MASFRVVLLALAATGVTACSGAVDDTLTPGDVTAIEALARRFAEVMVAGDVDAALAMRADDIVWMGPFSAALEGKDAVRQYLSAGRALEFTVTPQRTEGSGNLAYNRGTFTYRGVMGTDTIVDRGKYLTILRRQADNTWLIAVDIYNTDLPMPVPAPAPAGGRD